VLAVGLDAGGIVGLARSWEKVDCVSAEDAVATAQSNVPEMEERIKRIASLRHCQEEYGLIVLASPLGNETFGVSEIAHRLKPDGVLVCLGFARCDLKAQDLRRPGFQNVRRYAALPNCQPRVFFPTRSSHLITKGLRFHSPGSRRARRRVWVANLLSRLGSRAHLKKGELVVATRDRDLHGEETLAGYLSRCLGYPIEDFVVYAGSDSSRRKITALAMAAGERPDVVVKIADTVGGAEAIRQESDALRALAASPLAGQVPKLIVEGGKWNGCTIEVQSAAPRGPDKQIARLTNRHLEFLAELSKIRRTVQPVQSTKRWRHLCALIDNTDTTNLPKPVLEAIHLLRSNEYAKSEVVCHRTHGDFSPWNIRISHRGFHVVDWECSDGQGLATTDLFHFFYRQAGSLKHWPGSSAVCGSICKSLDDLAHREALRQPSAWRASLLLTMVSESMAYPSARLEDLIGYYSHSLKRG